MSKSRHSSSLIKNQLDKMEYLFDKNLAFLQKSIPDLYTQITHLETKPELAIEPNSGKILRMHNGKPVYNKTALDHAFDEIQRFDQIVAQRRYAPHPKNIDVGYLIKKSPFTRSAVKYGQILGEKGKKPYSINTDIVVFGVGLGYHIEMLVNKDKYLNITIIEKDAINFKASMYCIDWEKIVTGLKKNKSITFHIKHGSKDEEHFKATLRAHCHRLFPSIGLTTIIYNHYPDAENYKDSKSVIEEHNSHIKVSYEMIGPEAQRLFNANHNILTGHKCIDLDKSDFNGNKLICIVGAGPSLDLYQESIKQYREKLFLISCGSSLSSLVELNIMPDIHFELEFQNLANHLLRHVNNKRSLKDLDLIGTFEVNPDFTGLFKDTYMFIPETSEISPTIGERSTLRKGGITCTNGATAIISRITNKSIYLIGLDFAYTNGHHHSKTNISMEDNLPDSLKRIKTASEQRKATFEVETTTGGKTWTSPGLNSARLTMEMLLSHIENKVFNCSIGSKIRGSEYVSIENFISTMKEIEIKNKDHDINLVTLDLDKKEIHKRTENVLIKSLNFSNHVINTIESFTDDSSVNNLKVKLLFKSIEETCRPDSSQLRNMNGIHKAPLIQLFVITNFIPKENQKEVIKVWIKDYIEYIEFLKNLFEKSCKENNYIVKKDWMN